VERGTKTRWNRRLLTGLLLLAGTGAVLAAAGGWIASAPRPAFPLHHSDALAPGDPARGRIVFAAGDCSSCHASPGQDDLLQLGGGMTLDSPLGPFHPPNISSDPNDGIGRWTTTDLANALLTGTSPEGGHYYPTFPYASYAHMTVDDIRDLMAYLRTLPAVSGRAPSHELPFPFTIRRAIGLWKLVFLDRTPIRNDSGHDPTWNRGHYLVEAVSHCAECHSTRNLFLAVESSTRFAGGPDPSSVGYTPNITPAAIGDWSIQQISETLRTGVTPGLRRIGSSMASVVRNTASLPQSDRDAIAVYVKSLPPRPTPNPAASQ
jgi:mono/diheme cytochrome c family protein